MERGREDTSASHHCTGSHFFFAGGNQVPRTQQERSVSLAGAAAEGESLSSTFLYGDLSLCCYWFMDLELITLLFSSSMWWFRFDKAIFFMHMSLSSITRALYRSASLVGRRREPRVRDIYRPLSTSFTSFIWPSTPKTWMQWPCIDRLLWLVRNWLAYSWSTLVFASRNNFLWSAKNLSFPIFLANSTLIKSSFFLHLATYSQINPVSYCRIRAFVSFRSRRVLGNRVSPFTAKISIFENRGKNFRPNIYNIVFLIKSSTIVLQNVPFFV